MKLWNNNISQSKYKYPFALFPEKSEELQKKLDFAAARLESKLSALKLSEGAISPFIHTYLLSNLDYLQATLQRSTFLFLWALQPYFSNLNFDKVVLVDYGGGSGLFSLFAKELGIGTVLYVDIYDVCSRDARFIAQALKLEADHYINGDINKLLSYIEDKNISCNTVMSYDTMEHIYNIDDFLNKIILVSKGPLSLTLASGANPFNPISSKRIMRLQEKVEFEGKTRQVGEDPRNPEEPLITLRGKIILDNSPDLSTHEIEMLAKKTRGMRWDDIINAVNSYLSEKVLPKEPGHPTNTCDPLTGNWCEQLLDPYRMGDKLRRAGFSVKVLAGYYGSGSPGSLVKRFARCVTNLLITASGKLGLRMSPYYCVYAVR